MITPRASLHLPASILTLVSIAAAVAYTTPTYAQPVDSVRQRAWYDTLTPTRPRIAHRTMAELAVLGATTTAAIPIIVTMTLVSIAPPTLGVHVSDGNLVPLFTVGSGIGFGYDSAQTIFFPDVRLQMEAAIFLEGERTAEMRASLHHDLPLVKLERRGLLWFGGAGGAGVATTFDRHSPFAEGWIGVMNPMGVRFFGYFPMHNYGVRGRIGYDPVTDRGWYELSLGATATFWW